MLNHVVLVTVKDGVTDEQVDAVLDALAALPAAIPELRSLDCGRDLGLSPARDGADLAFVARFDSVADFEAYRAHPAHQALAADVLRPVLASVTTTQFETRP